jgi:hypothetical protein
MPNGVLPDPVARAIEGLMEQVSRLQGRVAMLEGELNGKVASVVPDSGSGTVGTGQDEARRTDIAAQ